ncbi:putative bifunctional diguanylate cyclase/phosphodiesterase [Colwellia echini]|uniref:Bifunctional diguanylate cyclase/phosphodiesterase n=1 Tax=Colwellia echini TaxID=1982103 RepID=A0ABY3MYR6_9GAMM|nr:bifunctional diguanylate cyclase/phosphodiesterase [Colwellia echini]TYK66142.1 bifunctional diguanylate cyclase/phosphodiesterase [Colwellia echini]
MSDDTEDKSRIDTLTQLPTRAFGRQLVEKILLKDDVQKVQVIICEISRFGQMSDSIGNALADKVLAKVARRLSKVFINTLCIYRTHGDHFCLVFAGDVDLPEEIERLQDFAQRPFVISGQVIVLSVRIGAAINEVKDTSFSDTMHAAEAALHFANNGGLKICMFEPFMLEKAKTSHQIANDLRCALITNSLELYSAINSEEFYLVYQPIYSIALDKVTGFEALLRWNHPERGIVPPNNFISIAEEIGVMDVLGDWILRKACLDIVKLQQASQQTDLMININVSPVQFLNPGILINSLEAAISESGIAPQLVRVEITESSEFIDSMPSTLKKIRALGCEIAIDDFGTGYSSIVQLTKLPLNLIKVDRSFVFQLDSQDPEKSSQALLIARGVYGLAHALGLNVITEGVETAEQLAIVTKLGADLIQGFYYAKPMYESEMLPYLQQTIISA